MAEFNNFTTDIKIPKTEWLVDNLVPLGHLGFVIAQAGIGKSYFTEQLAACIVYGKPFLGLKVKSGNVLLIDEDTPEKVLMRRLNKFISYYKGDNRIGEFRVKSMTGLKLSEQGKLLSTLVENDDVVLVVIDSFNAICGDLDPNMTRNMSRIQTLKQYCLNEQLTILINHHISEKTEHTALDLMTCDPHTLAMGSSVINQQADTYYILGSPTAGKNKLESLYVRPVSKREMIPLNPFKINYIEQDGHSYFDKLTMIDIKRDSLDEVESDIMIIYREGQNKPEGRTVNEIYKILDGKHGIITVRDALKALEIKGKIKYRKGNHNLFHYFVPEEKAEWPSPVIDEDEAKLEKDDIAAEKTKKHRKKAQK
jgi:hypothetical protein